MKAQQVSPVKSPSNRAASCAASCFPCNLCPPCRGPSPLPSTLQRNNTTGIGLKGASQAVTLYPSFVEMQRIVLGSLLSTRIALIDCATSHFHSCRKLAKLDNNLKRIMKSPLRKHLCPSVNGHLLCPGPFFSVPSLRAKGVSIFIQSRRSCSGWETHPVVSNPSPHTKLSLACQMLCFNFFFSFETSA